jgi:uncharacterized protein (DUF924 family)
MPTLEEVLTFWFGDEPAADPAALRAKVRRWYQGGPALDAEIRARFGSLVEQAIRGELEATAGDARQRLALIILLDQFPRSIHRDTPQAYAGDPRARVLALQALEAGDGERLGLEAWMFLVTPLLHAEDPELQERTVAEMERLVAQAPAPLRPVFGMGLEQSQKYRDIIRRFGRFPHRNAILGRTSTAEELAFMEDWAERAAPSGMRAPPANED